MTNFKDEQSKDQTKAERKMEAECYMARLYRTATPVWFNILGWIALLGAIEYFRQQSGDWIFSVILVISYFFLGAYFFTLITSIEFDILPQHWSLRVQRLIAGLFTGALFGFTFYIYSEAIRSIASASEPNKAAQQVLQSDEAPTDDREAPSTEPDKQNKSE